MRIFFITCCILFLSCRKEANVKLPETKSLPVIYSFICPDDTLIRLKLMSSSPLYSPNDINVMASVPNANVNISSGQGAALLNFNANTEYYELNTSTYPIISGQIYKITVNTINGDVATAETQVPLSVVPINTVVVDMIEENYSKSDRLKVLFNDESGAVNYYRIAASYAFVTPFAPDTIIDDTRINELYSDVNRDGQSAYIDGRFYMPYDTIIHYDVFLYNCSSSYYNFQKSILNYSGDNPFTEPTLIYSNVKGGFGCFAAYTRSKVRFKKK